MDIMTSKSPQIHQTEKKKFKKNLGNQEYYPSNLVYEQHQRIYNYIKNQTRDMGRIKKHL